MNGNLETVKAEFTKQAPPVNAYQETNAKRAFNDVAIERMWLIGAEKVLEVATGTCSFGKKLARHVG